MIGSCYIKRSIGSAAVLVLAYMIYCIVCEWHGLLHMHYLGYDYAFFYYAFKGVLHHHTSWTSLYNVAAQKTFLKEYHYPIQPYNQYVYPPQFAWFFSFFGVLPFSVSCAFWMATSVVLYFLGIFWMVKLLWPRIRRFQVLIIFLIATMMTPFQIDIGVGNVNSILFAAVSLSFYLLYHRHNPRLAGIPMGVAIMLKVTPMAILFVFMLRKQWKVCSSTILIVLTGTVLSSLFVGISPIMQYLVHFSSFGQTSMKNGPAPYNQSVIGVLEMFYQHAHAEWSVTMQNVVYILFSGAALWFAYSAIRRNESGNWRLDLALASTMPLICSPLVEEDHMVFVIPTLIVFVRLAQEAYGERRGSVSFPGGLLTAVITICVLLLSLPTTFALNFVVAHWPQLFWIHIQMFAILIISFGTILVLYRHQGMIYRPKQRIVHSNGASNKAI